MITEITCTTTLTGSPHHGATLVCSQPVTLIAKFPNLGEGFTCTVVNLSAGLVTFAAPVISSNGALALPTGQIARLYALSYSGGDVVFVEMEGGVSLLGTPGQVTG